MSTEFSEASLTHKFDKRAMVWADWSFRRRVCRTSGTFRMGRTD